jgi:tetratricopeptide (TPR) repeat protein
VKPLSPPDTHYLLAAQGWVELGNAAEAAMELERIAPELRGHPDVLEVRWEICARDQQWPACVELAQALERGDPQRPTGWIRHSFALHELKRTEEAYRRLAAVAGGFPGVWTIPYNLACYCSQLGKFDEAREWFKKAVAIDEPTVMKASLEDPDLKPMWAHFQAPI